MLTPFDILDKVSKIRRAKNDARLHDEVARARVAREVFHLYQEVLHEIARGSLDPRSLAMAALEVEK